MNDRALPLFPEADGSTVGPLPVGFCPYETPCRPRPLATFAAPVVLGGAVNVEVCCSKCRRVVGVLSSRAECGAGVHGVRTKGGEGAADVRVQDKT